ncbi:MAG: UxaA family hydrolase [Halobacteriaceae archaeon]
MSVDAAGEEGTDQTFEAYERSDRGVGVRNNVLVLPSVICSHIVAERIADRVDGAVSAPHDHGCAQIGADNDQTERTFVGLAQNPNVAGTVVVGLGCEHVQSDEVAALMTETGVPVRETAIQDAGGTDECMAEGVALAEGLIEDAKTTQRRAATLGDLTVGVVTSDADPTSVETADPLVGEFVRSVVDAGGRVLAAGTERVVPHREAALEAATDGAADDLATLIDEQSQYPARTTRVGREAAETSFESVTRAWGGLPVRDVVPYGAVASHDRGLALVDAPSRFEEAATGLVAAGAQVVVHVTADGIPSGHPVAPVVKVSGDESTVAALPDDIDVDATAADAATLRETVRRVADGDPSAADRHGLTEFAITRVGPSL